MKRYEVSASQWRRMESFLLGRPGHVGVTAKANRRDPWEYDRELYR